jgi:hypothetical protein
MMTNIPKASSGKPTQVNILCEEIHGICAKKSMLRSKQRIFVKSLTCLTCLCVGVMTASSASAQFAGPLTKEGIVTACRESGSDFGDLKRVALDIPSDTLSCDFQRASTAAKISRACQVTYGGNAIYNIVVSYRYSGGGRIPTQRRKGCWY